MRTVKPKVKREIKVNKKKEIPIKKVKFIDEDIEKRKFLLESIYRIYENMKIHKDIWTKEIKQNNGYLNPYYKMLMGRIIKLSEKLIATYISQDIQRTEISSFWIQKSVVALMQENISFKQSNKNKEKLWKDDSLPFDSEEFYNSLMVVWGVSIIIQEKLKNIMRLDKIQKEMDEMINKINKLLDFIDTDIVQLTEEQNENKKSKILKPLSKKKMEIIHAKLKEKGYLKGA